MTVELPIRKAKKVYCVYGVLSNYYQQLLFILQGTKTGSSGTYVSAYYLYVQSASIFCYYCTAVALYTHVLLIAFIVCLSLYRAQSDR